MHNESFSVANRIIISNTKYFQPIVKTVDDHICQNNYTIRAKDVKKSTVFWWRKNLHQIWSKLRSKLYSYMRKKCNQTIKDYSHNTLSFSNLQLCVFHFSNVRFAIEAWDPVSIASIFTFHGIQRNRWHFVECLDSNVYVIVWHRWKYRHRSHDEHYKKYSLGYQCCGMLFDRRSQ